MIKLAKYGLRSVLMLAMSLSTLHAISQSCVQTLENANLKYNNGQFESCIADINKCLTEYEDGYEILAYKLLAKSYLQSNDVENATKTIDEFIRKHPRYLSLPNDDPSELRQLYRQVEVRPILSLELGFSALWNTPQIGQRYSTINAPTRYSISPGYAVNIAAELFSHSDLSASLGYSRVNTRIENTIADHKGVRLAYTENLGLDQFSAKVYYKKSILEGMQLGVFGMGGMGNITSSDLYAEIEDLNSATINQFTADILSTKIQWQPSIGLGILINYDLPLGRLKLEAQRLWFMQNTVDPDNRFLLNEFVHQSDYIGDDLKLRWTTLSLSYQLPIKGTYRVVRK